MTTIKTCHGGFLIECSCCDAELAVQVPHQKVWGNIYELVEKQAFIQAEWEEGLCPDCVEDKEKGTITLSRKIS